MYTLQITIHGQDDAEPWDHSTPTTTLLTTFYLSGIGQVVNPRRKQYFVILLLLYPPVLMI